MVHGWCDVGDFCFWGEVGGEVDEFPLQRNWKLLSNNNVQGFFLCHGKSWCGLFKLIIHKPNLYLNIKKLVHFWFFFWNLKVFCRFRKKSMNNYPHLKRVLLTGDFFFRQLSISGNIVPLVRMWWYFFVTFFQAVFGTDILLFFQDIFQFIHVDNHSFTWLQPISLRFTFLESTVSTSHLSKTLFSWFFYAKLSLPCFLKCVVTLNN